MSAETGGLTWTPQQGFFSVKVNLSTARDGGTELSSDQEW